MLYFKKKKMYAMLQSLVGTDLDMMKSASYRFYRGAEWLECCDNHVFEDKSYKLYHSGSHVSLDIFQYDSQEDKYVEVDRITYQILNEQLVKTYQRTAVS